MRDEHGTMSKKPVRKSLAVERSAVSDQRSEAVLIIFAKAPVPGQVKTRLCPPLTPDEAASLHGSFVLDALERSRGVAKMDRILACDPSSHHVFFKIMEERQGVRLVDQMGEGLGARMSRACTDAFTEGYRQALIVGSDLPTLQPSVYTQAVGLLAQHDLVLGPAHDGGYYLLGLGRPVPELFEEIPWSTDQVLALTQRKADSLGLKTALLPPCRDVDRIEDVVTLIEEEGLATGRTNPTATRLSKRTAGALRLIAERLKTRGSTG